MTWRDYLDRVGLLKQLVDLEMELDRLSQEGRIVYPPKDLRYRALELTPLDQVKVVILGQDPYHQPGQAMGLSFSVHRGQKLPPSLVNIFKELKADLGIDRQSGDLTDWAQQGVLLLNSHLSVEEGKPLCHVSLGWDRVTNEILQVLNRQDRPIVYILWGKEAQSKAKFLDNPQHLILQAPHPSPLSAYRGFFGSAPFSQTNQFLTEAGLSPIHWEDYLHEDITTY